MTRILRLRGPLASTMPIPWRGTVGRTPLAIAASISDFCCCRNVMCLRGGEISGLGQRPRPSCAIHLAASGEVARASRALPFDSQVALAIVDLPQLAGGAVLQPPDVMRALRHDVFTGARSFVVALPAAPMRIMRVMRIMKIMRIMIGRSCSRGCRREE